MSRLRLNNLGDRNGTVNPITVPSGSGTCSWVSSPGFPTIASPDYAVIVVEPGTANEDIRRLTAYTSGATSGTISGALTAPGEQPSSGAAHTSKGWAHSPTQKDFETSFAPFQEVKRRSGAINSASVVDGRTVSRILTGVVNIGTTVVATTDLPGIIGQQIVVSGVTGITNVNGTWVVSAVQNGVIIFTVTSTPSGTYTANSGRISATFPVLDVILGHSYGFGFSAGASGSDGIGISDQWAVLGALENRQAGLPDPGRGFKRVQSDTTAGYASDTWSNRGAGSVSAAGGPVAGGHTSWTLAVGNVIGDTAIFRRAIVLIKRITNGDGVQVSVDGGSTFSASFEGSSGNGGVGYTLYDTGDLGSDIQRTLQVKAVTHVSGTGTGGVEVAGYIPFHTSGDKGAYQINLSEVGGSISGVLSNTDWDANLLAPLSPIIRRVIHVLGINDLRNGDSLATVVSNYTTLVGRTRTACPLVEIVIVIEWHPGITGGFYDTGITGNNWYQYVEAIRGVADTVGATVLDMYAAFGDVSINSGDSQDPYGLSADNLHPGDALSSIGKADTQGALAHYYWDRLSFGRRPPKVVDPGWIDGPGIWTKTVTGSGTAGNQFTVPGNHTQRMRTGTYLRWAESGTVHYGVVASSSYSATTFLTTVIMIPTTSHVMTNTPDVRSNWHAVGGFPSGFPSIFAWTPQFAGVTGGTFNAWWSVANGLCTVILTASTNSTGSATSYTAVLPVTCIMFSEAVGSGKDNNTDCTIVALTGFASTTLTLCKAGVSGASAWTASGNRQSNFVLSYPIV